jgi:thiamine biosynthesis lipoprotein
MKIDKITFRAMGTQVMAALESSSKSKAALRCVPAWFDRWERSLSRFQPDSELNRLNRANGDSFKASATLFKVVQISLKAAANSDGLVTPEVLDSMEAIGYRSSFESISSGNNHLGEPWFINPRLEQIDLDPSTRTIHLPRGTRLDLGGFGKGWAVKQAMLRLSKFGPALVDAGGDIAISKSFSDGQSWLVGVDNPLKPGETKCLLELQNMSVATSGRDRRRWLADGIWQHHLIDPRTSRPAATDILTATILATDLTLAEMASKSVLIQGSRDGLRWLEERPNLTGVMLLENGEVITTPQFEKYIWRKH